MRGYQVMGTRAGVLSSRTGRMPCWKTYSLVIRS